MNLRIGDPVTGHSFSIEELNDGVMLKLEYNDEIPRNFFSITINENLIKISDKIKNELITIFRNQGIEGPHIIKDSIHYGIEDADKIKLSDFEWTPEQYKVTTDKSTINLGLKKIIGSKKVNLVKKLIN